MKERLAAFADDYAVRMSGTEEDGEERRRLRHPLVYLFLGERAKEALELVYEANRTQWAYPEAVMYLYAGKGSPAYRGTAGCSFGDRRCRRSRRTKGW
ncbi:hypothetical protein LJK87_17740 [Paenibacillus sp. P25]|nr:hypothetical protein LJK87_17740 [Paenibacillus sp. P25]